MRCLPLRRPLKWIAQAPYRVRRSADPSSRYRCRLVLESLEGRWVPSAGSRDLLLDPRPARPAGEAVRQAPPAANGFTGRASRPGSGPGGGRLLSVRPGRLSNPGLSGKLDLNGSQRAGRRRGAPPQQHVARWHAGESNAASLQGRGSCGAGTACQGRAIWHAGWHGPSGRAI